MSETEASLRRELEAAFRDRAHLYRLMLDELEARLGAAEAETALAAICARRGREVAGLLFEGLPAEPATIGRRFLSVSPDGGRLYPHVLEETEDSFSVEVASCPLKNAWSDWGLSHVRVATLCRIAGAFDRGLFEAAGLAFDNSTWTPERGGGCCRIALSRRPGGEA